jgi:hypothetical protein
VQDSTNLQRSIDQFEQWLLTAKMRAKHDQLATGIRIFGDPNNTIPDPNNPLMQFYYSAQIQYIQQPDPLSGGWLSTTQAPGAVPYPPPSGSLWLNGGILFQSTNTGGTPAAVYVTFYNVDFSLGLPPINSSQYLVQPGDYLELRDSGIYLISGVVLPTPTNPTANMIQLTGTPSYYSSFPTFGLTPGNTPPTTNYRILRQPRILMGEPPLQMPSNFAVDGSFSAPALIGPVGGPPPSVDILFSPSGAVIGPYAASGKLLFYIHDSTQNPVDPNRGGIVAVQTRTGFIGAYAVAPGADPFLFAEEGRDSGL